MSSGYIGSGTSSGSPWPALAKSASESSWTLITDEETDKLPISVVKSELWEPGQVPSLVPHPAEKRLLINTIFVADFDNFDFPGLSCLYQH